MVFTWSYDVEVEWKVCESINYGLIVRSDTKYYCERTFRRKRGKVSFDDFPSYKYYSTVREKLSVLEFTTIQRRI